MHSFCEEDYAFTAYLAEFINSLTNLAYGMSNHSLRIRSQKDAEIECLFILTCD
jgi:hypothetical protein